MEAMDMMSERYRNLVIDLIEGIRCELLLFAQLETGNDPIYVSMDVIDTVLTRYRVAIAYNVAGTLRDAKVEFILSKINGSDNGHKNINQT